MALDRRHLRMLSPDDFAPVALPDKTVVILFRPTDLPDAHTLLSNASASDLIPVLRAVLVRLEAGTLRMPLEAGVHWVDVECGVQKSVTNGDL